MRPLIYQFLISILFVANIFTAGAYRGSEGEETTVPYVNDYDCFFESTEKIYTLNKDALRPTVSAMEDSIESLKRQIEICDTKQTEFDSDILEQDSILLDIQRYLSYTDKIKNKEEKERLKKIVVSYISELEDERIMSSQDDRTKGLIKDASKGKLSYNVIILLQALHDKISEKKEVLSQKRQIKIAEEQMALRRSINDYHEAVFELKEFIESDPIKVDGQDSIPTKHYMGHFCDKYGFLIPEYLMVNEQENTIKIKNPWKRGIDLPYNEISFIDIKTQCMGWEWVESETDFTTETIHYPNAVTYKEYASHPGIRIADNCAFDKDGKLLRVLNFTNQGKYSEVVSEIGKTISNNVINNFLRKDYESNKYNIKEAGNKVVYAVENLLGISDAYKKARDKRLEPLKAAAEKALLTGNTTRYKQLVKKHGLDILGLRADNPSLNTAATNYIKQCRADHENDEISLWKIERLSDTSFKMSFIDKGHSHIRNLTICFLNDGPYKVTMNSPNEDSWKEKTAFDFTPYQTDCD